MILSKTKFQRK